MSLGCHTFPKDPVFYTSTNDNSFPEITVVKLTIRVYYYMTRAMSLTQNLIRIVNGKVVYLLRPCLYALGYPRQPFPPSYPGRANFSLISLKNSTNCLHENANSSRGGGGGGGGVGELSRLGR